MSRSLLCFSFYPLFVSLLLSTFFCELNAQNRPSVRKGGTQERDMTSKLEFLGNPYQAKYKGGASIYARNIWTMKFWNGLLYLGAGNSANGGPASNAGPVPVISFNPANKEFKTEWNVPDEQIDVYRIISGALCIPGHDPKEDWSLGNFYRKKTPDANWEKIRTFPNGVHMYDLAEFNGTLLACGYGVGFSHDDGKKFVLEANSGGRVYSFLLFKEKAYAPGIIMTGSQKWKQEKRNQRNAKNDKKAIPVFRNSVNMRRINTKRNQLESLDNLSVRDLFPNLPEDFSGELKFVKPHLRANTDTILYIAGKVHNDHQFLPLGLYEINSRLKSRAISLPPDLIVWDINLQGNRILILGAVEKDAKNCINYVYELGSTSGNSRMQWRELLSFRASTFARSFEYENGYFYFGMGSEIKDPAAWKQEELKEETGNIYRIPFKL